MARRILHVCDNVLGGIATFLGAVVPRQLDQGDEVTLAIPDDGTLALRMAKAGARHCPWQARPRPGPSALAELASLRAIVRATRPDIVHLHNDMPGLLGRTLLRGGRPTVFQPHAWSFVAVPARLRRPALAWERWGARWTSAIVCVSESERSIAADAGIDARLVLARNGVDLVSYSPQDAGARRAARARLGVAQSAPLSVCIGRLHRQKGQHDLLDAWPLVRAEVANAELALVGAGPDREELESRRVVGVRLYGASEEVVSWLAAADVVVLPSRWEGLSMSLLEALACSRSVVVTDVPGMREVVAADVGAVVPAADARALAAALVTRLRDPSLVEREGRAGRALVVRDHDVIDQHRTIAALYTELCRAPWPRG